VPSSGASVYDLSLPQERRFDLMLFRELADAFFLSFLRSPIRSLSTTKKKTSFVDPLCSTCDALASALSEASASGSGRSNGAFDVDCRSCCTPGDGDDGATSLASSSSAALSSSSSSSSSPKKPSSAVLEVCRSRLRSHRHVDEFIKHKLTLFGGQVRLRDRYNSPPRIHFLDAGGKRVTSGGSGGGGGGSEGGGGVRIDHWRTEDIESFLRERLAEKRAS